LEKERRELDQKARAIVKKIDHIERAFRKEEIPLLEADYQVQQDRDILAYENKKSALLSSSKLRFEKNLKMKQKMQNVMEDYASYKEILWKKRNELYAQYQLEASEKIEAEKAARREEVMKKAEEARLKAEGPFKFI
jgi:translation initiation factor 3 subunit A